MNFLTANHYAAKLMEWIALKVDCAQVAGSIRRERAVCNDVDIVCIPRIEETRDLFGAVSSQRNVLHEFLREYVASGKATFQSGGEVPGKSVIVQLPKCQLDLWFATGETFATRLLCRTGSREHNIWLASRAKRMGLKWNPYEGILIGGEWQGDDYAGGQLHRFASEADIYLALDLPFIEPKHRELSWLTAKFGG